MKSIGILVVCLVLSLAAAPAHAANVAGDTELPARMWCVDHYEYGATLGEVVVNCAVYVLFVYGLCLISDFPYCAPPAL